MWSMDIDFEDESEDTLKHYITSTREEDLECNPILVNPLAITPFWTAHLLNKLVLSNPWRIYLLCHLIVKANVFWFQVALCVSTEVLKVYSVESFQLRANSWVKLTPKYQHCLRCMARSRCRVGRPRYGRPVALRELITHQIMVLSSAPWHAFLLGHLLL